MSTLTSGAQLLRSSLHHYRVYAWYFITLYSIPFGLTVLALIFSVVETAIPTILVRVVALAGAITTIIADITLIGALSNATMGDGIILSARRSVHLFLPLVLASTITLFISLGGFTLLIIPGVIVTVYLSQVPFLVIGLGQRSMDALLASWQLVHSHFWKVLVRLLILWVVTALALALTMFLLSLVGFGSAPSLSLSSVLTLARGETPVRGIIALVILVGAKLLLTPFAILYLYGLYRSLQANSRQLPQLTAESLRKRRALLVGLGVLGAIVSVVFIMYSRVLFNFGVHSFEFGVGPNRDFVRSLIEVRSLAPKQIQSRFTR